MIKRKIAPAWWWFGVLCLLGLCLFSFSAIRFSAYVVFGIAFLVLCYRLLTLMARKKPRLARCLRCILTVCLCILLLAAVLTEGVILRASKGSAEDDCDYLIVLGAGVNGTVPSLSLQERLDTAYDYLIEHPDTICVVSGGQGSGEDITEAACMYNYLTSKGIGPERILLEDKATSTQENLVFSKDVIAEHAGKVPDTVAILSAEYHLYRASLMAKELGLNPILIPARTSWVSLRVNYFLREIAGVWYFFVFGG